eukprot:4848782-Pyramimonas_sp.AAC.1
MDGKASRNCCTCTNKRCGYKGNFHRRTACRICGAEPPSVPKGSPQRGPSGKWNDGPSRAGPSALTLSDELVAVYAKMPGADYAFVAQGLSPKTAARDAAARSLQNGDALPTARAARRASDAIQRKLEHLQSKCDKAAAAAAEAVESMQ